VSAPLGFATLDLDRERRQGLPEVVFAPGKTAGQIAAIVRELLAGTTGPVLVTRVEADTARAVLVETADAVAPGRFDESARLLCWRPAPPGPASVVVVTAGTADGPVAAEAVAVATAIGLPATLISDVGVAGLHRLLARIEDIAQHDVVIVVAGMEGALASVLGGLVAGPVIAVPTSTGYGAALEGVTALLAMLSSCAAGVTVVNIDSGFGAAMAAHRLASAMSRAAIESGP
jgi:NCAIR mutase (PurE)-related protein